MNNSKYNSNLNVQSILNHILLYHTKIGGSDRSIEKEEFLQMSLPFFKAGNYKVDDSEFIILLKSINRKKSKLK
jgi:hypothetical protein